MDATMDKNALKALLKEHLTIELKENEDMYSRDLEVIIKFDNEEITSDRYQVENKGF